MKNKTSRLRFVEIFGIITFCAIIILWIFCSKSVESYSNTFFIDARDATSYSAVWDFSLQKFFPLINTSFIFLIFGFGCYILLETDLSEKKAKHFILKKVNKVYHSFLSLILSLCVGYFFTAMILFFSGVAGSMIAGIDKERFNNRDIFPQILTIDKPEAQHYCSSILGTLGDYTFVMFKSGRTELIRSTRILSIKPMLLPIREGQEIEKTKTVVQTMCGIPKNKFIISTQKDFYLFKAIWWFSNLVMRPTSLL